MRMSVKALVAVALLAVPSACGSTGGAKGGSGGSSGTGGSGAVGGTEAGGSGGEDVGGSGNGASGGIGTGGSAAGGSSGSASGGSGAGGSGGAGAGGAATGGVGGSASGSSGTGSGGDGAGGTSGTGAGGSSTGGAGGSSGTGGASSGGAGGTSGGAGAGSGGTGGAMNPPVVLQSGVVRVGAFFDGPICSTINFPTAFTGRAADLDVVLTASHPNSTMTHDALTVWVERVTARGFSACVHDEVDDGHPAFALNWVAYDTANVGAEGLTVGRVGIGAGDDRACSRVNFPSAFAAPPTLQVTPSYAGRGTAPNDAPVVWVEDVTASGFQVCATEHESADGTRIAMRIQWLAQPAGSGPLGFTAGSQSLEAVMGAGCVMVDTGCVDCDNVQVSLTHRGKPDADAIHDPALVWAEALESDGSLTFCAEEIPGFDGSLDGHAVVDWLVRDMND